MLTRKQFIRSGAALASAPLFLQACFSVTGEENYETAVRRIWRASEPATGDRLAVRRELVRYATLAPSSHNTQCWKFRVGQDAITILPDLMRRTPAVDPDDHHLYVSLGCATENLVQAALANGLNAQPRFDTAAEGGIRVALESTQAVMSPLYQAIPARQCTRAEFDGKQLSNNDLKLLEQAGQGDGVQLILLTEKASMEKALEYIVQGNTAQMNDPAFVSELKAWIRFGDAEAVRTGDGLFSRASGNPSVPRWVGSPLFSAFFQTGSENEKYVKHVRSSAGIAIFASQANDKAHWIEVGRCYERFALQATALGIRNAFLNQPVEVSALRPQFASFLGIGDRRPDLVVRFGRGPEMPRSLRRSVGAVLT